MTQPPIVPHLEYNPSEIVKYGWIKNSKQKSDYRHVLRLIRYGKLQARNVCLTGHKYFKVLGSEIIKYQQSDRQQTT